MPDEQQRQNLKEGQIIVSWSAKTSQEGRIGLSAEVVVAVGQTEKKECIGKENILVIYVYEESSMMGLGCKQVHLVLLENLQEIRFKKSRLLV